MYSLTCPEAHRQVLDKKPQAGPWFPYLPHPGRPLLLRSTVRESNIMRVERPCLTSQRQAAPRTDIEPRAVAGLDVETLADLHIEGPVGVIDVEQSGELEAIFVIVGVLSNNHPFRGRLHAGDGGLGVTDVDQTDELIGALGDVADAGNDGRRGNQLGHDSLLQDYLSP
jgi:hypothetical protein